MRHLRGLAPLALLALSVAIATPAAQAASFDCQRAMTTVEKRICDDWQLSDLDGRMAQAYAQARNRASKDVDALQRDQTVWLAFRNAQVLDGQGKLAYEERLALLNRAFREGPNASPLLETMAVYLRLHPDYHDSSIAWSEYGRDKAFDVVDAVGLDEAKNAPFDMQAVEILTAEGAISPRSIQWFAHEHIGAVVSYGGSMRNELWNFFRWGNEGVRQVDLPAIFDNTITQGGDVVDYHDIVSALKRFDESQASSHVASQALLGEHWEAVSGITFRFDVKLLPPKAYCSEPDCAGLVTSARDTMIRYDRERDGDALSKGLTDDRKAAFRHLVERAQGPQSGTYTVPAFDGKRDIPPSSYSAFDEHAVYFPVMWKGEMLLGRIGQATFPNWESDDLILGIWRPSEHGLVPVLSMSGEKQRTRFLFSVNDAPAGAPPDQL
jgi:uncharacterized protein